MFTKSARHTPFDELEPFDRKSDDLNVIIETPKGCRNKFDYNPDLSGPDRARKLVEKGGTLCKKQNAE